MPPRSKDTAAMRRFAAEHARAHARLATVRVNAACACRATECAFHDSTRSGCSGTPMLVLVHNPAVGQVWTLAEVCQECARLIPHITVLGRAQRPATAAPTPAVSAGSASAARVTVPGGFSSPEAAPEAVARRRPHRGGPRRTR